MKKKHQTVAELIKELQKLRQDLPICMAIFESCITDAGTEMGCDREYTIEIHDLETRIVLERGW